MINHQFWNFEYSKKFIKQYKSLSSDLRSKVDLALEELAKSDDPAKLGEYKSSLDASAYVLDKSNRILYKVRFEDKIIELRRVGDHKKAYKGQ